MADKPEAKKSPKRIKKLEVMVAETIRETHDTTTLMLFSGNESLDYKPGHFCTIDPHQFDGLERWGMYLEYQKGKKEKPRAYSLASSPHEKYLAVTIKEERYIPGVTKYPPLLSPILVRRIPRGTRMEITGFTGPYYLPDDIESRTDHVVHICAGSGFVPNWSIIKYALHHDLKVRHTVIYGNRTWDDVIYRHALEDLRRKHPDKLKVIHALSREPGADSLGPQVYAGRVGAELIHEHIPDPSAVEVFACGPALSKCCEGHRRSRNGNHAWLGRNPRLSVPGGRHQCLLCRHLTLAGNSQFFFQPRINNDAPRQIDFFRVDHYALRNGPNGAFKHACIAVSP